MKKNIIKKLKLKKILLSNRKKIIDLFYVENDFYYSIIYNPKDHLWEPINNSSSPEPVCLSSVEMEDEGLYLFLRTSLPAHRETNKFFQNKENKFVLEDDLSNNSELKNLE